MNIPTKASHARQEQDGVFQIIARPNFDRLDPAKPVTFGTYKNRKFLQMGVEVAPDKQEEAVVAAPDDPVASTSTSLEGRMKEGKTRFIAELIIAGQLTARQIADRVGKKYNTSAEAELGFVRAVPWHLKQMGIIAIYKKASRGRTTRNSRVEITRDGAAAAEQIAGGAPVTTTTVVEE